MVKVFQRRPGSTAFTFDDAVIMKRTCDRKLSTHLERRLTLR